MTNKWKEREQAKEEEFFANRNKEALRKLKDKDSSKKRLSPITGDPMDQVTVSGIVVDHCAKSGYVGLDSGDLKKLLNEARKQDESWLTRFFEAFTRVKDK